MGGGAGGAWRGPGLQGGAEWRAGWVARVVGRLRAGTGEADDGWVAATRGGRVYRCMGVYSARGVELSYVVIKEVQYRLSFNSVVRIGPIQSRPLRLQPARGGRAEAGAPSFGGHSDRELGRA